MVFTSKFSAQTLEFLADAYINLKLSASDSAVTFSSSSGDTKCLLENVATCTSAFQAANKTYVDAVAQGLAVKAPVICVSAVNTDLSQLKSGSVVNDVTLATGNRILLIDETSAVNNGIYVIAVDAPPPRAADMATGSHPAGSFCFSEKGAVYADAGFVCTSDAPAVVGTDPLTFVQFSQAGVIEAGTNLNKDGNTLNLDDEISLTSVTTGTLVLASGSITDSTDEISFGDAQLTTTAGIDLGTLTLGSGSILDSSGAIDFSSTDLTTTGYVSASNLTATAGGTFGGTLELASASIQSTTGAINFGNNSLSCGSGSINAGTYNGNFALLGSTTIASASITDTTGAITFGSTDLDTTGDVSATNVIATEVTLGTLVLESGSIADSSGAINFGSTSLSTTSEVSAATIVATGDVSGLSFTSTSDARLKENIRVLQDPLEKVRGLRGVSFDWIETKHADVGVLAQDVQQVLPELVRANDDGVLRVDYPKLAAVLIEAVKLLELKVLALETRQHLV